MFNPQLQLICSKQDQEQNFHEILVFPLLHIIRILVLLYKQRYPLFTCINYIFLFFVCYQSGTTMCQSHPVKQV